MLKKRVQKCSECIFLSNVGKFFFNFHEFLSFSLSYELPQLALSSRGDVGSKAQAANTLTG